MPDLSFQIDRVEPESHAAVPTLSFKLRIEQSGAPVPIHTIALRCQIRIEPGRRRYDARQTESLFELFGAPDQWSSSLRPMLWTHAAALVPPFSDRTTIADLPVPCTWDFNLAATKYFDALGDDGDIPLCLLFTGTVFHQSAAGALQAAPIAWDKEASFRLPARTWRDLIDRYYPNAAWLSLQKDTFDRLRRFKLRAGCATWEQAIDALLEDARQEVPG